MFLTVLIYGFEKRFFVDLKYNQPEPNLNCVKLFVSLIENLSAHANNTFDMCY